MNNVQVVPEDATYPEPRFHAPCDTATNHVPAISTQATTTLAATTNSARYIVTAFAFNVSGIGLSAGTVGCSVIAGTTGGTTYLWREILSVSSTGTSIFRNSLNITAPANTAVTIEFDRAITGGYESVNITTHQLMGIGS